ncbi:MAG: transposase [Chitinophagaceae bacterium]|nr:transposase [Chitinophagaceae bacterium]
MANTYTQLHIHIVFAVKYRACLIDKKWRDELYKYITGIIQKKEHKVIAINGMPDHIHIFIGMRPTSSLSDLVKDIKAYSSKWINEKGLVKGKFRWQSGFGAFSYSKSHLSKVALYIENQERHHEKKSMIDEYKDFLGKFEVDYNESYIFQEPV